MKEERVNRKDGVLEETDKDLIEQIGGGGSDGDENESQEKKKQWREKERKKKGGGRNGETQRKRDIKRGKL